jgi:metal-responsive CopG/Arc/MetJ family transcriptional regulator
VQTKAIRLPDELTRAVDRIAEARRRRRSDVIREAIERYVAEHASDRLGDRLAVLDRLVTYPGSGVRDLGSRSKDHLRKIFDERRRRGSR